VKFRKQRWTELLARAEEVENTFNILVAKLPGEHPLGIPISRGKDNIKFGDKNGSQMELSQVCVQR
jgi:hypothetical protein